MRHTSHIRIDLNAIASNLRAIHAALGSESEVCAVVKADAYGLGARRVARALVTAGVRRLAVFTPEQAADLEEVAPNVRILVLMPLRELPRDPAIARMVASGRIELVVVDHEQVAALARIRVGRPLRVHVEVDCGMGRSGIDPHCTPALVEDVQSRRSLKMTGLFTHFNTHERESVTAQAAIFDSVIEEIGSHLGPKTLIHTASSGPCFSVPEQRRKMVRIGLGWTGWLPCDQLDPAATYAREIGLRGVVTWASSIVQVRAIAAGASVGYGSEWVSEKATRIGLIPVGYSDGYPTTRVNQEDPHRVLVQTREGLRAVPVVGAVSMDQLMVDLGAIDASESIHDREVILLSDQPDSSASLHAVANRAGISSHALLACLGKNVPRVYLADAAQPPFSLGSGQPASPEVLADGSSMAAG